MRRLTTPVIWHWYRHPGDLLPPCCVCPGRDAEGTWHAGGDRSTMLEALRHGVPACRTCVRALSGNPRLDPWRDTGEDAAEVPVSDEDDLVQGFDGGARWTDEPPW